MITDYQKNRLKEVVVKFELSTIKIETLYKMVSKVCKIKEADLKTSEYNDFYIAVKWLEGEDVIKPYGKASNAMMGKSLPLRFKINKESEEEVVLLSEDKMFLYSLNSLIDTSFYFKNVQKLNEDREDLKILSDFLDNVNKDTQYISVNERSYELFGYEKRLTGAGVKSNLMARTGLENDDICCFKTYTPLQCHIMPQFYKKSIRNILIVENLDTYWSFHRAMIDTEIGDKIDMLVYGCGNKASGNFKFHRHYAITEKDKIHYFGDIDPEGLAIYRRLKDANEGLDIALCEELYALTIEIAKKKGIREINNANQSKIHSEELRELLGGLESATAMNIMNIVLSGKYIPQEAISYRVITENVKK